jgi:hypothetical protein
MWAGSKDWKILKPITDINCTNYVNKEVVEETKDLGYEALWVYNGGSSGSDPKIERIFYGIHPWKVGAKGVTQFQYQASSVNPFDMFATDHIGKRKREVSGTIHFYAYPSSSGPIPTPHWEAVRQGIYDYRYLFTLKKMIKKAYDSGNKAGAEAAQKVLAEITSSFPYDFQTPRKDEIVKSISNQTLDIWRWKAAKAIMELK